MMPPPAAERPQKRTWKYKEAAQAFRESLGDPQYTMVWNDQLDHWIDNRRLPAYTRGVAYMLRHGPGNLSHVAVDRMPVVDSRDQAPRKLTQAELSNRTGLSTSTCSSLVRAYRDDGILLPETDGFYLNPGVQPSLFAELRQNGDVSPLDESPIPGVEFRLHPFEQWRDEWQKDHPEHLAAVERVDREIEELDEKRRQKRDERHNLRLVELAAYREHKRVAARAARNGNSHSAAHPDEESNLDSTPAEAPGDSPECGQEFRDSTPKNDTKPSAINDNASETIKGRTEASSSGGKATKSATTTTVHTPVSHHEGSAKPTPTPAVGNEDTPSKAGISYAEFHQQLSVAFRAALKPVPTPSQSAACYAAVCSQAAGFLAWLAGGPDHAPKLPVVRHPGVLPSLVEEFQGWIGAEPPPAPHPPPSEPTEDQERRLMVEYAEFREAEALRLFDALPTIMLRGLIDEKHKLLRREGRLDRMALDVRQREAKNLILLDIEREQAMPFAKWVEMKRKSGTSP